MSAKRVLAAVVSATMISLSLPAFAASAQAAPTSSNDSFTVQGPGSVEQGDKVVFTAHAGKDQKNRLAVLEESTSKGRIPISVARVGKDGKVVFKTTLPVAGRHNLDVRIVKGRTTSAISQKLTVDVSARQLSKAQKKESARELAHAASLTQMQANHAAGSGSAFPTDSAPARGARRLGVDSTNPIADPATGLTPIIEAENDNDEVGPWFAFNGEGAGMSTNVLGANGYTVTPLAAGSVPDKFNNGGSSAASAEVTSEEASEMAGNAEKELFGDMLGGAFLDFFVSFGMGELINLMFPSHEPTTAQMLQDLTNDMQANFNQVNSQLQAIESGIDVLGQQVSNISAQVTSTNASAAAANCTALMGQANGYVTQIQDAYDNYQDTLSPTWINANLIPGADSDADMRVVGNQVFGSGSGTPSFLQGVNSLQQATINLSNLLTGVNMAPGNSLIDACSSAVASKLAASANGYNNAGFVTPAGVADEQYFNSMQAITAYYASNAHRGQFLSNLGSQWAILTVDPTPPTSAADASSICDGTQSTSTQGSSLTCAGLEANINAVNSAIGAAWDRTGASWGQVTNGALVSDTRLSPSSDYLVPARTAWSPDPYSLAADDSVTTVQSVTLGAPTCVSGTCPSVLGSYGDPSDFIIDMSAKGTGVGTWTLKTSSGTTLGSGYYNNSAMGNTAYGYGFVVEVSMPASAKINTAYTLNLTTNPYYSVNIPLTFTGTTAVGNNTKGSLVQSNTFPSSGLQVDGLTLQPAKSAQWNNLLQLSSQAPYPGATATAAAVCGGQDVSAAGSILYSCTAASTMGQLMSAAGLEYNGAQPSQLVFTGETSPWNAQKGPAQAWLSATANMGDYNEASKAYSNQSIQSWSGNTTFTINSFIDPAFRGNNGFSAVIQDPAAGYTTLGISDLYAWGGGQNFGMTRTGEWQPYLYAPCNSNWSGVSNHYMNSAGSGATRLWAQWMGLPAGTQYSVPSGNTNGCNQSSFPGSLSFTTTGNPYGTFTSTNVLAPGSASGVIQTSSYLPTYCSSSSFGDEYCAGGGPSNVSVTVPSGSPIFNPFASSTTQGIMWPAFDLTQSTCLPSGPLNGWTRFSTGAAGNVGTTQLCEYLWAGYKAAVLGEPTGNLNVITPDQRTGQPTGQVATIAVYNGNSTSTNATLYLAGANGVTLPGTVTAANGSAASVTSCAPGSIEGVSDTACSITIPAGMSEFNIPITYASGDTVGDVTVLLSDWSSTQGAPTSYAGGTMGLIDQAVNSGSGPNAPVNLAVSASSATASSVAATWTAPSASPAITGYTMKITDPKGNSTSQSIAPSALTVVSNSDGQAGVTTTAGASNSDMQVTTSISLPSSTAGRWTFALTATNAVGTSAAATVTTFLGDGPPPQVMNLRAIENANGTVTATWTAVNASPNVSGYTVTWQGPDGQWYAPQTVSVPRITIPSAGNAETVKALSTGTWTFQVAATNAQGTGPTATAQVNVVGSTPKAVGNLEASIDSEGMISARWNGADAVPAPSTYNLAIYSPNTSGTAILTQDFPVTGVKSLVNIPNFFQIGNDSKPGMYTLVVTGSNGVGIGEAAASDLYISQATINRSTLARLNEQIIGTLPGSFHALAAAQCQAGLWQSGYQVFGTCDEVNHLFTSNPNLPALAPSGPLPTQGQPVASTNLTQASASGPGAASYSGSYVYQGQKISWAFAQNGSGQCKEISTGTTGGASCPLVTNVTVDSAGNFSVGVRNRNGASTTVNWYDDYSGYHTLETTVNTPNVGSSATLVANVVRDWMGFRNGAHMALSPNYYTTPYSIVSGDYEMTGTMTFTATNP